MHRLTHLQSQQEVQPVEPAAEPVQLPAGLSIPQILAIADHYWKFGAAIAVAILVLSAVVIKLLPQTYVATATLIVNPVQQNPVQQQIQPSADYVATQGELIMSPIVLLPVVDQLGLVHDSRFVSGFRDRGPAALRQYAEQVLAANLNIQQGAGNQLLYLSASEADPVQAAAIANAVANSYLQLERQRANDPVARQAQRSSQELAALRAQVNTAQDQVTQFRQKYGLTSLNPSSDDAAMQALQDLQKQLLAAQNERRSLKARQAGEVGTGNEALESTRVGPLRSELSTLQARLAQLRPTLGPRHPEILALESQITSTRSSLLAALQSLSGNVTTQLARERELEANLTQAVATQRASVLRLRQIQDQGSKLRLELQSAQSVYSQALAGYDQVKSAALQNFANVSLISRATPPVKSAKPNKPRLLVLAALLALAIGIAVPFGFEMLLDRRVRCRDDLERGFGIRLLAQLDCVQLPPDAA
ncbi:MAG: GumC family protein [Terriglobales bacterium]